MRLEPRYDIQTGLETTQDWIDDTSAIDFLSELKEFQARSAEVEILVGCRQ